MYNEAMEKLGKIGEDIAGQFLINKGYSILGRNYRKKFGEIDIIGRDKSGTLVFVEVKTLSKSESHMPEDNFTLHKSQKMRKISQFFMNEHPELVSDEGGCRMDLVAIVMDHDKSEIRHYENVG